MILVTYDISSDSTRTKFSKFLKKYGYPLQYSVYEIRNSKRVLENVLAEIESRFEKKFTKADSVLIFQICEGCQKKITKFGYPKYEDSAIIIL